MLPAIDCAALTKRYADDAPAAVEDLSFTMPRGATWGLLGGNGAGKTTTIAMLLGLLIPSSGRVSVLGHDMATARFSALARINFSSPYVSLPHRLSVRENLTVYGHLYGVPRAKRRIAELVERFQMGDFIDRAAGSLSAGQKTRVAIAKALINTPDLLLLDEPTASLDPDTGDWVRGLLESYSAETGAAILLASHNMAEVERLCSHVLMLKQGRVVDSDSPAGLLRKYGRDDMEQVFLDIARDRAGPGRAA